MKLKTMLMLFLKGTLIGTADIIPGVSGGTVALILGVYEKAISTLSGINYKSVVNTLTGRGGERIDLPFVLSLGLGIGFSILALSKVIVFLLENAASQTYAFFFVVILGSAVILFKNEKIVSLKCIFIAIIGFVVTFFLAGLNPTSLGHSLPVLFVSGIVATAGMILPGVSGSMLLLFLNQYGYMLKALHEFKVLEIVVFLVGGAVGMLGVSHLLKLLLSRFWAQTIALLLGLMLGGLRIIAQNIQIGGGNIVGVFIACCVGVMITLMIEMYGVEKAT